MSAPTILRQRIRLILDTGPTNSVVDAETGNAPRIYPGCDCQLELLFRFKGEILDITNLYTIRLEIKATARTGDPIVDKTVSGASIDYTISEDSHANWDAGTSQHALVTLVPAETAALTIPTGTEAEYFITVSATTTAGTGALIVPLGFGLLVAENSGLGGTGAAIPIPPTSYTKAESDARYLGGAALAINPAGFTITLTHATNGKQVTLGVNDSGELAILTTG